MPHVITSPRVLPDLSTMDSDRLKALIVEQHFQLISHDNEIENLKLLILKLQRMQFGPSSEKWARHIDQLELRLEDLESNKTAVGKPSTPDQESGPARKPLPADLHREVETLAPKHTACPDCGRTLKHLRDNPS